MYAIAGGVLIVLSSVFIGGAMITSINRQINTLAELMEFIRFAEMRISCFGSPLSEIYDGFDAKYLKELFSEAKNSGLYECLEKSADSLDLSPGSRQALFDFAKSFGKTGCEEQINSCKWTYSALSEEFGELTKSRPARIKLYSVCSVIFGLMLVIIIV